MIVLTVLKDFCPVFLVSCRYAVSELFIIISLMGALSQYLQNNSKRHRAESFEACCQWALLERSELISYDEIYKYKLYLT